MDAPEATMACRRQYTDMTVDERKDINACKTFAKEEESIEKGCLVGYIGVVERRECNEKDLFPSHIALCTHTSKHSIRLRPFLHRLIRQ